MIKGLGVVCSLFISVAAFASNISFISKDASVFKDEKIQSVLVQRNPTIFVSVHSQNLSCRVDVKSFEEARTISERLTDESKHSWIQCFSDQFTQPSGPQSFAVVTERYSLGTSLE